MDAKHWNWGIELELAVSESVLQNDGLRIGPYHHGIQVPFLPEGWKAEHDGSIQPPRFHRAVEVVSPILCGPDGLAELIEVARILESKGFVRNRSMGCHVHINFKRDWPADVLARLVNIFAYCEKGLYAITGTKSRERGMYCGGVRKYGDDKTAKPALDRNRYHLLNLTNLANGTRETIEVRAFQTTLRPSKLAGYVQVCLGLVERAFTSKRSPVWSPRPLKGGWRKKGEGASEAERLMGYLAWGAGYAKLHGGHSFGWVSDIVPQEEIKAEFRRLAAKYDSQP